MNIKRKQHYVWKKYLKPWTENGQIFCKLNNLVFLTALENIGQKRFFYESTPLNVEEFNFIMAFCNKAHPTAKKSLSALLNIYMVTAGADEYVKKCGIEEFHARIESGASDIIDKLCLGNLSFFRNDVDRNNFGFFLGCQYTRTDRMRRNVMNAPLMVSTTISKEKLSNVFSLFFADVIGNWIYSSSKIKLLINQSDLISFITADQPIINVKEDGSYTGSVREFELYYPISPKIAIYLSEKDEGVQHLDGNSVKAFNKLIVKHSSEQLYAKHKTDFDSCDL